MILVLKSLMIAVIALVLLIPITVFAQYSANSVDFNEGNLTGFYSNEEYNFSFEYPKYWINQENAPIIDYRVDEVVFFPPQYHISNIGDDVQPVDEYTESLGWEWQLESPVIGMDYEIVTISDIETMNEENVRKYMVEYLKKIPSLYPPDIYTKAHSWGWEAGVTYYYDLYLTPEESIPSVGMEKSFFFKDRQKYNLYYVSTQADFKEYKPYYDHAIDTLTVNSIAVPEFGHIAMLILTVSIVSIVVVSRKSSFLILR